MPEAARNRPGSRLAPLGRTTGSGADGRLGVTVSRLNRHVVVVTAAGEVDLSTAGVLRAALRESLHDMAEGCIAVLDLSRVGFLDSSGVHVLVEAYRQAQSSRTAWRLCGMRPIVAQALALTHVDRLFSVHPDLADALTWTG